MGAAIQTYHCACTALILATPYSLDELPSRKAPGKDNAIILPMPEDSRLSPAGKEGESHMESSMHHITADPVSIVVRREDGFETRTLVRCERCNLVVAYRVNLEQTQSNVLFVLPESLTKTEDMKERKFSRKQSHNAVAQGV